MMSTVTERNKHERTCVGCGEKAAADAFVRLVLAPDGASVAMDVSGSSFGRGAHVHPSEACLALACKGGLSRAFRTSVVAKASDLRRELVLALDRRAQGLLVGARRAGYLVFGADGVCEALAKGAPLAVVARDAAAAADRNEVRRAIADGRAVAFMTKESLGSLFGREEVAVLAVTHAGIAKTLSSCIRTADSAGRSESTRAIVSGSEDA
ncbi:MAG TPA: DUF448 domain-containing protein [Polyangiaceae bacterium]